MEVQVQFSGSVLTAGSVVRPGGGAVHSELTGAVRTLARSLGGAAKRWQEVALSWTSCVNKTRPDLIRPTVVQTCSPAPVPPETCSPDLVLILVHVQKPVSSSH